MVQPQVTYSTPPPPFSKVTNHTQTTSLQRAFTQIPITALSFYRDESQTVYLLAGEDTHLVVYDVRSGDVVAKRHVFHEQPIHGVHVRNQRVLAWGGRHVSFFDVEVLFGEEGEVVRGKAEDWVYDGVISPYDSSGAVLATAHNEILQVHCDASSKALSFGPIISPSRPILYAANLKWLSEDTVLVAGGTVFGDILIWKCHLSQGSHEMLSVLSGHEGSIFGVHISDELQMNGRNVRLLASCSDDRTVRIWDITENEAGTKKDNEQQLDGPRETGFGSTTDSAAENNISDRVVAVAMGHGSRIWGVKFAIPEGVSPDEDLTIYSFGEDSTTQRWRLNWDASSAEQTSETSKVFGRLTHQETFSFHDGKHLWSRALLHQDDKIVIAIGGADGKISLISDPKPSSGASSTENQQKPHDLIDLVFQDVLATLPSPKQLTGGREEFARYDLIATDQILAVTTLGRLLLGTFKPELTWQEVSVEESVTADLKLRYVFGRIGDGVALLGTTNGKLYHYSVEGGITLIHTLPRKIFSIFNLSRPEASDEPLIDVLVALYGISEGQHFTLDRQTGAIDRQTDVKGLDRRFVATAASIVGNDLIAIGSRHGFLSLLRRGDDGYRPVLDEATRSRDAITDLVPLPPIKGASQASPYFLATTRDGKYRIYEIEENETNVSLQLRHETSPPLGPMIEGAWFTQEEVPELILYGFKSKNFIIWNETRRQELVSVECGGAHRTFSVAHHPTDQNILRFAYTKVSRLYVYSQHRSVHRPLKRGIHGREVRALASNGSFIATGSEDTSIRIWDYRKSQRTGDGRELQCLAYMKLHVTGLQRVKWLDDDYLFSSAGNEEFFIWRIRRLEAGYTGLGVVCEAVFDDKSRDGDLRVMDFDVQRFGSDNSLLVTLAMSNSSLKTYRYTRDRGFQLLAQMSYTGACITQIRYLRVNATTASVLTASTDGHLATWEVKLEQAASERPDKERIENHVLVQVVPIHQSGIKSLDLVATAEGFLVLTGGDDNGLGVTSVVPLPNDAGTRGYTMSTRGIVRRAHAAAINGVVLRRRGDEFLGVSVSNDQRVKTWKVGQDMVKLVSNIYSGVADPGDIDTIDDERVILGGVGVEVWAL